MSSKVKVTRIQRLIQAALRETPLSWSIDGHGRKHRKLYIEGRMVMVFSHGEGDSRDIERVRSFIRRAMEKRNADPVRAV